MSSSFTMCRSSRAQEEADMHIKTADGEPLPAESLVVRVFSSCAKQLPADTAEWDVSGFLYNNGQPFSHATVKCWLSCASSLVHGPAELDADDKTQLSTAKGLHAVLAFADAVGSSAMLLTAACSQLDSLQIVVQLPEQTLQLRVLERREYTFAGLQLYCGTTEHPVGQPLASDQQALEVQWQVAEQIGALLHMAHVLRLQPLIDALHDFLFFHAKYANSVLYGVLELVFSAATIDVVLGSGTISKETYVESVMTRPCRFDSYGQAPLFKPVGEFTSDATSGAQEFAAQLLESFGGYQAGEVVQIRLNLFSPGSFQLEISSPYVPVPPVFFSAQLQLGLPITSKGTWESVMSSKLPKP